MYSYSLIIDRKSYTLPNKTIYLVEEMERVSHIDAVHGLSTRNKFEEILKFVVAVLGEDNATEVLGSLDLSTIDPSAITITFRMIVDAYNKPIVEYNARKGNEVLASIPSDKIDKISKLLEAAKTSTND